MRDEASLPRSLDRVPMVVVAYVAHGIHGHDAIQDRETQDAETAIRNASELLPGAEVTVLTIWKPFATMLD
jgi:hypothetical protein